MVALDMNSPGYPVSCCPDAWEQLSCPVRRPTMNSTASWWGHRASLRRPEGQHRSIFSKVDQGNERKTLISSSHTEGQRDPL